MVLSKRAASWLKTLDRETPIPTVQVEQMIVDAGESAHQVWLDFHENYAGYVEEIGSDEIAIWGLARSAHATPPPMWCTPDAVEIIPSTPRLPVSIFCADVNPVHGYRLFADGRFRGIAGPTDSFEMKIERHGLIHDFYGRGRVERKLFTGKTEEPQHQDLIQEMTPFLVPEASSKRFKFYVDATRLLEYSPKHKQLELFEIVSST